MTKVLLITGATGRQGGALIDAILSTTPSSPSPPLFRILAVTRNTSSARAQALLSRHPTVELLQGDQDDVPAIYRAANTPIWGVFSVQLGIDPNMTPAREEAQGIAMIDAALANGVQHFVYASATRGRGAEATVVPQFRSKHRVEAHLRAVASSSTSNGGGMSWTILRPAVFFENLTRDVQGLVFAGAMKYIIKPGKSIQYIAVADVGRCAYRAFLDPERFQYQSIDLAGESLNFTQLDETYRRVVGRPLPLPYGGWLLPWLVCNVFVRDLGIMFRYFDEEEFPADLEGLRGRYDAFVRFGDWLVGQGLGRKDV